MLPLYVFYILCCSIVEARELEKRIPFNRFYETEQPALCAHAKKDGPPSRPPPLHPPPSPTAFYLDRHFSPSSFCLHFFAFVKTAHHPLPLCLCPQFILKLIQAVLLLHSAFLSCSLHFKKSVLRWLFLFLGETFFSLFQWVWRLRGWARPSQSILGRAFSCRPSRRSQRPVSLRVRCGWWTLLHPIFNSNSLCF